MSKALFYLNLERLISFLQVKQFILIQLRQYYKAQLILIINIYQKKQKKMMFTTTNRQLSRRLTRLIPQIQQIVCSKFTNFLTINTSVDNTWAHSGQLLHVEHMEAVGYLQANFKNHIVNKKGINNYKKIVQFMRQSENFQLLEGISPSKEKLPQKNRKNFYIFDPTISKDQMMECQLMRNKAFNKIICFPKQNPLQLNQQFQKFCLQHNVRALGLTDFSVKSLMNQVSKNSRNSTLIHELIDNDISIYKQNSSKVAPGELILFLNMLNVDKVKNAKNFLSFKQIAKNYYFRQTFEDMSKTRTSNFKICRFQLLQTAQKVMEAIQIQEEAMEEEET